MRLRKAKRFRCLRDGQREGGRASGFAGRGHGEHDRNPQRYGLDSASRKEDAPPTGHHVGQRSADEEDRQRLRRRSDDRCGGSSTVSHGVPLRLPRAPCVPFGSCDVQVEGQAVRQAEFGQAHERVQDEGALRRVDLLLQVGHMAPQASR